MLPAIFLRELGIEPVNPEGARVADGGRVEFQTAWARFSAQGRNAVARGAVGPADEYLLGATTLEDLGMVVVPLDQRLIVRDDLLM